jgi:5-methylcytosine-specific restriction endonuclease McrA
VTCSNCGDEIEVQPIKLETQDNYFCDFGCYGDWLSETNFGEAHHQYKPNKPTSRFYQTAKWRAARVEALDRDNHTCQGCGETNKLVVHHIIPIADNGPKYDLDNLVTLCRPCHAKWEGLYLRPDTR